MPSAFRRVPLGIPTLVCGVAVLMGGCHGPIKPWQALEVQSHVLQTLSLSTVKETQSRAKAFAVQAEAAAEKNPRLVAAAHLAAAWAEHRRGEGRLGARYVRKALAQLEPSAGNSQVLLAVAMKRAEAGHKKEATELLQWWLEYIDGETHAALRPPVAAYLKKLKTPSPTEPSEHLQRLQKLLEPVKGQVNPPN